MTTPAERREMFLDAAEQTEEWNREQRREESAGFDDRYDPRDNQPDARDLAEMAYWDRLAEKAEREAGR